MFSDEVREKLRAKMRKKINLYLNKYIFFIGLCGVLLSFVPYFILRENAIVPYHDQLDGELLAYIYQAKYLFSGSNIIPEFLGGAAKMALVPPAPLAVLLFKVVPPFVALILLQAIGQIVGYIGMFRLTEQITDKKLVAFVTGVIYAFLPFLPVYGLSQYGMPMLLLSIYYLYRGEKKKRSLGYVALYGAMSSLVLCGFAWLAAWTIWLIGLAIVKRLGERKSLLVGYLVLLGVYVVENLPLLGQMLGIRNGYTSHKSEYVSAGEGFYSTFWSYLLHNGEHSEDSHIWIGCLALAVILLVCVFQKKWEPEVRSKLRDMLVTLGAIVALCLVAALWDCSIGVTLKEKLGTLGTMQLDRVLWLAPMLWLVVLVYCLDILWSVRSLAKWFVYGASMILLGCVAIMTLKNSLVKPCIQKVLYPDYNAISYSDYLAIGVMEQVEAFLQEERGISKTQYRVASLGIDPAAALYHGFYCVDGYSNNYDLEYKHAFREVIALELEKSEWLKGYFDDWGNRCYLYSSECPGYYTVEKGGFAYQNLEINARALKDLGCEYVFSAAYISNAQQIGFTLLREEAFETADSYYRIFVYGLSE